MSPLLSYRPSHARRVAAAAAVLVRRGEVTRSSYRWWHQEVRRVVGGYYHPQVADAKTHVWEALAGGAL